MRTATKQNTRQVIRRGIIDIGVDGIRLLPPKTMPILPRRSYLYGASSSPSLVYVLSVDDERVHYQTESELRKHGESAPVRVEQLWIFADLAARGTRTRIDQLCAAVAASPNSIYEEWLANLRAKLEGTAPEELWEMTGHE